MIETVTGSKLLCLFLSDSQSQNITPGWHFNSVHLHLRKRSFREEEDFPLGFPGGSVVKELACHCKRHRRCSFSPSAWRIPSSRKWQPTPVFLLGKFHGQRNLVVYSPCGYKESDTTERTQIHTYKWPTIIVSSRCIAEYFNTLYIIITEINLVTLYHHTKLILGNFHYSVLQCADLFFRII